MASSRFSESNGFRITSAALGTVCLGIGIHAILRPRETLALVEFDSLASTTDERLINSLLPMLGFRDIFMSIAIYAASYFGSSKTLGWVWLASGGVAFGDGLIAHSHGLNYMNHWVFVPIAAGLVSTAFGAFDKS